MTNSRDINAGNYNMNRDIPIVMDCRQIIQMLQNVDSSMDIFTTDTSPTCSKKSRFKQTVWHKVSPAWTFLNFI